MSPYIRPLFFPVLLFGFLSLLAIRYGNVWEGYRDTLFYLPFVLFAASGVIALYLLQYGFLYTAALFVSVYTAIQLHLQTTLADPFTFIAYLYINLLAPILVMLCLLWSRKPLFSISALFLLFLISSLAWAPYLFFMGDAGAWLANLPSLLFRPLLADSWFSIGMLMTYLPVFAFLSALFVLNPTGLQAQWLVGLLVLLIVFVLFSLRLISSIAYTAFAVTLLVALLQEAFLLAFVDELTGIPARKALQKQMLGLGRRYSIAMLDVDHFKKFNDTYGHDVGDQVLRMVAAKINQVSGGGKAYRYGGEEFTILFQGKTAEQALPHLETVREAVANYIMQLREEDRPKDDKEGRKQRAGSSGKGVKVTISIGVAERGENYATPEKVIKAADQALYTAKKAGRNCVKSA
jgi:diguanylate cyclase (GGDEF)-like protein